MGILQNLLSRQTYQVLFYSVRGNLWINYQPLYKVRALSASEILDMAESSLLPDPFEVCYRRLREDGVCLGIESKDHLLATLWLLYSPVSLPNNVYIHFPDDIYHCTEMICETEPDTFFMKYAYYMARIYALNAGMSGLLMVSPAQRKKTDYTDMGFKHLGMISAQTFAGKTTVEYDRSLSEYKINCNTSRYQTPPRQFNAENGIELPKPNDAKHYGGFIKEKNGLKGMPVQR